MPKSRRADAAPLRTARGGLAKRSKAPKGATTPPVARARILDTGACRRCAATRRRAEKTRSDDDLLPTMSTTSGTLKGAARRALPAVGRGSSHEDDAGGGLESNQQARNLTWSGICPEKYDRAFVPAPAHLKLRPLHVLEEQTLGHIALARQETLDMRRMKS